MSWSLLKSPLQVVPFLISLHPITGEHSDSLHFKSRGILHWLPLFHASFHLFYPTRIMYLVSRNTQGNEEIVNKQEMKPILFWAYLILLWVLPRLSLFCAFLGGEIIHVECVGMSLLELLAEVLKVTADPWHLPVVFVLLGWHNRECLAHVTENSEVRAGLTQPRFGFRTWNAWPRTCILYRFIFWLHP